MKKVFTIILMMFLVIGLSSCQNNQDQMTNEDTSILVAYYWPNSFDCSSDDIKEGELDIQEIVDIIDENIEADFFEIETEQEYSQNLDELSNQIQMEKQNGSYPQLKSKVAWWWYNRWLPNIFNS